MLNFDLQLFLQLEHGLKRLQLPLSLLSDLLGVLSSIVQIRNAVQTSRSGQVER
jgi:hypothetical protein